jgi:hypothetical protein
MIAHRRGAHPLNEDVILEIFNQIVPPTTSGLTADARRRFVLESERAASANSG